MNFAKVADNTLGLPSMMISPWSREGSAFENFNNAAPASGTYAAANRAHYYLCIIPSSVTVYKLFWLNGATVGTNNFQVGLYYDDGTNKPGAAVFRGTSTLAAGANACQYDNIADQTIGAGRYWLAIWGSGTTATLFRTGGAASRTGPVYLESALASGLPATATPATVSAGNGATYMFGLVCRSTP